MLRYFEFTGRSTRSQYWQFMAVQAVFILVALLADFMLGNLGPAHPAPTVTHFAIFVHLVPALAMQVRRLHDVGISGGWALLLFVPFVGLLVLWWACLPSVQGETYLDAAPATARASKPKRYVTIPQGVRMGSAGNLAVSGLASSQPSEGRFI